jgi:hypothetical protein
MLRQLGQILSNLQGAPGGAHRRVWDELSPWLTHLASHAAQNWLPRLAAGNACQIPLMRDGRPAGNCPGKAIAACVICGQPVCLAHAFVDKFGEAVCYLCIVKATTTRPADPPPPASPKGPTSERIAWARKTLKLKRKATLEDARVSWRKLSGEHHPDRFPEAKKAEQEALFKEIQQAYEIMQQVFAAPPS